MWLHSLGAGCCSAVNNVLLWSLVPCALLALGSAPQFHQCPQIGRALSHLPATAMQAAAPTDSTQPKREPGRAPGSSHQKAAAARPKGAKKPRDRPPKRQKAEAEAAT